MRKKLIIERQEVTDRWRCLDIWIEGHQVGIYNGKGYIHVCFGRDQPDKLKVDGITWELKKR